MSKVLARGIRFHVQTRGEGPDVVLIHGVTSSLVAWYNGILTSLVAAGLRVTVYDLRGHGLSESTPTGYSSRESALDLAALLDELGISQVALAGHSFGGAVAMHFALLYPERTRGVVLLDSGLACLRPLRIIQDWGGWKTPGLREEGFTPEWFQEEDGKDDLSEFLRKGLSVPRIQGFGKGKVGLTPRLKKLLAPKCVKSPGLPRNACGKSRLRSWLSMGRPRQIEKWLRIWARLCRTASRLPWRAPAISRSCMTRSRSFAR